MSRFVLILLAFSLLLPTVSSSSASSGKNAASGSGNVSNTSLIPPFNSKINGNSNNDESSKKKKKGLSIFARMKSTSTKGSSTNSGTMKSKENSDETSIASTLSSSSSNPGIDILQEPQMLNTESQSTSIHTPTHATNNTTATTSTSKIIPSLLLSLQKQLSTKQIIQFTLTGIQLSLCFYLCKGIIKSIVELIDEYDAQQQQQFHDIMGSGGSGSSGYRNGSGGNASFGGWKVEDHDMPFLNEDNVDNVLNELRNYYDSRDDDSYYSNNEDMEDDRSDDDCILDAEDEMDKGQSNDSDGEDHQQQPSSSGVKRKQNKESMLNNLSSISSTTSNLAIRLHSAGLPIVTQPSKTTKGREKGEELQQQNRYKNVQNVLKSLTRTEGYLLSNSLLSPIDLHHENGSVSTDTTATIDDNDTEHEIIQLWNDIGGLEDVKEGLLDIAFPLMAMFQQQEVKSQMDNDSVDEQNNIQNPSYYGGLLSNPPGLLLYGPPGCGKTMLVRALAHTVNARFLCITPSTLLRKYVGETNLNVRALFSLARKISPCIIFIDEMEGLFRERSGSSGGGGSGGSGEEHEVNRELKTEFMQLWDGIQGSASNQDIVVIGATNRPFDIDSAFLRRMPRSFFVGLPDFSSRGKILEKMLTNVPLDDQFDIEHVAKVTDGYTPSDIKEVLRSAALTPLREARMKSMGDHMKAIQEGKQPPPLGRIPPLRPLTTYDVLQAQKKVSPTQLSPNYRSALLEYASKATGGRVDGVVMGGNSPSQWNSNPRTTYSPPNGDDGYFFANFNTNANGNSNNNNSNNGERWDEAEYDESSSYYDDDDD